MGILAKFFGSPAASPESFAQSQLMPPEPRSSQKSGKSKRDSSRRELLRVALRETLHRYGIPATWIGAEALVSTSRSGAVGVHWRLLVRHWDPQLLTHSVALQQKLLNRVITLDPSASNWLTGISWQFALPDESVCPGMPPPGTWSGAAEAAGAVKTAPVEPSANVIAGPVRISDPGRPKQGAEAQARADLERLLAAREADYKRRAGDDSAPPSQFSPTQPMHYD